MELAQPTDVSAKDGLAQPNRLTACMLAGELLPIDRVRNSKPGLTDRELVFCKDQKNCGNIEKHAEMGLFPPIQVRDHPHCSHPAKIME